MKFKDVIKLCSVIQYFITSLSSHMVLYIQYVTCQGLTAHRAFSGGSREGSIETNYFIFIENFQNSAFDIGIHLLSPVRQLLLDSLSV